MGNACPEMAGMAVIAEPHGDGPLSHMATEDR